MTFAAALLFFGLGNIGVYASDGSDASLAVGAINLTMALAELTIFLGKTS